MDYEYKVEVRDFIKEIILYTETYNDSNTAYHVYREMNDQYRDSETVVVSLFEPSILG